MLALITQRHQKDSRGDYRDILEETYSEFFEGKEIMLFPISNSIKDLDRVFSYNKVNAIIISGGDDIDPVLYGGDRSLAVNVSGKRDKLEHALLKRSVEENIPLLGICRGMQQINVFFGGMLEQGINKDNSHPVAVDHSIYFSDPKFVQESGRKNAIVNSYHNQGIRSEGLSKELRSFAVSQDGIVEGLFHPSLPIAGIQWHPERISPDNEINDELLRAFRDSNLYWSTHERRV